MLLNKTIFMALFAFALLPSKHSLALEHRCIPAELRGATVYVPVYSHIYHGDRLRPFNLAVTVSLRNTDSRSPITISRVDYYDTNGRFIRNLLAGPFALMPLHSSEYKIKESDTAGGSGGSVLIQWSSEKPVSPLLAESVMIGASSAQGISYSSRGQIIEFEP